MGRDLRTLVEASKEQYQLALPKHVPSERFVRVVQTALQLNPELAQAERTSFLGAVMKAAQDGLLPDGREGALVIYRKRNKTTGQFERTVQWMPMIAGLLKKIRNSGEIAGITAHVVYTNDKFHLRLGDQEEVLHEPNLDGDRGQPRLVYAICKLRDGTLIREWMTMQDIARIRASSRAADSGPWVDWPEEMMKKSALRRLIKRLPASSDKEDTQAFIRAIEQDDEDYAFGRARDVTPPGPAPSPLDDFAEEGDAAAAPSGPNASTPPPEPAAAEADSSAAA
jgi:recombination protein RecT